MPIVITLFVVLIGGFVAYKIYSWKKQKAAEEERRRIEEEKQRIENIYKSFVEKNSISLEKLKEITKKYNFKNVPQQTESHSYDNEKLYSNISCKDYLIYQLQFGKNQHEYLNKINQIKYNKNNFERYYKEIGENINFGEYKNSTGELDKEKLNLFEKALFEQSLVKPQVDFLVFVSLTRTDKNGYCFDKKRETFNENQILDIIRRLRNKNGQFFNDNEIWDSICRVERGRISNAMRFYIYNRDGYRCQCCGRTELEDNLEIDHIVPIAKGGKSVESNLQTLCHDCNIRKGTQTIKYSQT